MSQIQRDISDFAKYSPVTAGLIVLLILSFFVSVIGFSPLLEFNSATALMRPWTFLTYPFALGSGLFQAFVSVVFVGLVLGFIGRILEIRMRRYRWNLFLGLVVLAGSAVGLLFGFLTGRPIILGEPWVVLGGIVFLWALDSPDQPVLVWGIIPVKSIWMAWIMIGINFFSLWPAGLLSACIALVPPGVAWLWKAAEARRRPRYGGTPGKKRDRSHLHRIK